MLKKNLLSLGSIVMGTLPLISTIACGSDYDWVDLDLETAEGAALRNDLIISNSWNDIDKIQAELSLANPPQMGLNFHIIGDGEDEQAQTLLIEINMDITTDAGTIRFKIDNNQWTEYSLSDFEDETLQVDPIFLESITAISQHSEAYSDIFL